MEYISSASVILIVLAIISAGIFQKKEVFSLFAEGAAEGIRTILQIAPSIIGLVLMVTIFQESGFSGFIAELLSPLCKMLGFPEEAVPLALIRPVSGSGALAVLDNILSQNGADSFAGRVASVMMGSTETTFYTIAMYFGSVGISKTGCTVPCALLADITGMIMSVVTVCIFLPVT